MGIPTVCGRTSTITITGRAMYRLSKSLISKSEARNFGPVWYHPIIRSLAVGYIYHLDMGRDMEQKRREVVQKSEDKEINRSIKPFS